MMEHVGQITKRNLSLTGTLVLLLGVMAIVPWRVIAQAGGGTWTTKAPMPTARYGPAAGVINGILYVAGGADRRDACDYSAALEAYDPATNTWTTKMPMPTAPEGLGVGVVNGILYAVGGSTSCGGFTSAVAAYDPNTNAWTTKASMSTPRYYPGVGVVNGVLYVAGGWNNGSLASVEAYDPVTNTWMTKASMPTPRSSPGVGVVNGVLYVVGGSRAGAIVATVEAYDPSNDTWTTRAPMPTARFALAAGVINGVIYAIGGEDNTGVVVSSVEAYDPVTNSWTTEAPMPTARSVLCAGVANGVLYAVGGFNNGILPNGLLPTNEAFTPATAPSNSPPIAVAGPDQTVPCTSGAGAMVKLDGTGSFDPDGDPITFHWDAPHGITLDDPGSPTPIGIFPIGKTLVTLTVSDGRGGVDSRDVMITVVDKTPPEVHCTTNIAALWPPNHRMVPVSVFVQATDDCTAPQKLLLLSVNVRSNEHDNGLGDGDTPGDVNGSDGSSNPVDVTNNFTFNPDAARFEGSILLRAERAGNRVGRAYTIKAWVVDTSNNIGYASCVVVVPLNQKKNP